MMKIARNLTELIGHTPLVELSRFAQRHAIKGKLIAKIEAFNPSGSVKARAALAMIEAAEAEKKLKPGSTLIEPTSGNTGIGLAMIAAIKGYRLILTMPDSMSIERQKLLSAYGAIIVLTPASEGMNGSIQKALSLNNEIPDSYILQQFNNPANPYIHEMTTAEEIWADTAGCIDAFVACVGTGGTLCGCGRALKRYNPSIRIVGVEPSASPLLQGGIAGSHQIQGIGANFIPANYDSSVVDEVIGVSDADAFSTVRELALSEGFLAGISSGAALYAARQVAERTAYIGKNVIVLLPDGGERYLSIPSLWS